MYIVFSNSALFEKINVLENQDMLEMDFSLLVITPCNLNFISILFKKEKGNLATKKMKSLRETVKMVPNEELRL